VRENLIILLLHFAMALVLSLLLTPFVRFVGAKLGAFDQPSERKSHLRAIPRIGGVAMFLSFLASLLTIASFFDLPGTHLALDGKREFFLAGGLVVFGVGLFDDFYRISHRIKFAFQLFGSTIAYLGGVQITNVFGLDLGGAYGLASYAVTVFWFVLFINAINLIDGLDSLAVGIAFFTSTIMAIVAMWRGAFSEAFLFGALAGACLGFLRYNFNPASIFMGDSGSYFLGYIIAGISILSSSKSEVGTTILIPFVALGVPILDTILAPMRRFILGKGMFRPDAAHIHHRLVALGLSTRNSVLVIYIVSAMLCIFSLALVNWHLFGVLAVVAFLFLKKLGYLQHVGTDRIYRWIRDVYDEAGLSRDRRSFLGMQLQICGSRNIGELWQHTCRALTMLDFDMSKMRIDNHNSNGGNSNPEHSVGHTGVIISKTVAPEREQRAGEADHAAELIWTYNGFDSNDYLSQPCMFKLELPLQDEQYNDLGKLWLVKDLKRSPFSHYTLKRVEHLRRSVTRNLKILKREGAKSQAENLQS
jgi:UDP-GlcNAc:undecaprenyl-phosphate/decaprenyl-phosphate GlcNAc-1-phosphate transferase